MFPQSEWKDVSSTAKDFISSLIVRDPQSRATATKCLEHDWLRLVMLLVRFSYLMINRIIWNELHHN